MTRRLCDCFFCELNSVAKRLIRFSGIKWNLKSYLIENNLKKMILLYDGANNSHRLTTKCIPWRKKWVRQHAETSKKLNELSIILRLSFIVFSSFCNAQNIIAESIVVWKSTWCLKWCRIWLDLCVIITMENWLQLNQVDRGNTVVSHLYQLWLSNFYWLDFLSVFYYLFRLFSIGWNGKANQRQE